MAELRRRAEEHSTALLQSIKAAAAAGLSFPAFSLPPLISHSYGDMKPNPFSNQPPTSVGGGGGFHIAHLSPPHNSNGAAGIGTTTGSNNNNGNNTHLNTNSSGSTNMVTNHTEDSTSNDTYSNFHSTISSNIQNTDYLNLFSSSNSAVVQPIPLSQSSSGESRK